MGLSDRFTRGEWTVLLLCLGLQTVNTTVGYYVFDWLGVEDQMIIPLVLVAGGVFVLPILGIVVLSRPTGGRTPSEYQYSVSEFENDD